MSDIDFDELDRAVNGALGSSDAPRPTTPVVPVERTTLQSTSSSPSVPTPAIKPIQASVAPAARRSSGRFMDMVHPSSDMKSRMQTATPTSLASPLQPVRQQQPEPQLVATPVESTPAWNEPLESPFLPDAKVNKRPLGGLETPVDTSDAQGLSFDFKGLLDDEPDEILLEAPQPQERIEAHVMPDPIDFAAAQAVTADIEAASYEETVEEPVLEPEVIIAVPEDTTPQPVLDVPVGPTSIMPQYKEQPSTVEATGAMFDTESYHQPVVAPVKKKSGWLTVLLIVLLAILGAGGGWAVSTYVLPML
jgi:hypothetical protein